MGMNFHDFVACLGVLHLAIFTLAVFGKNPDWGFGDSIQTFCMLASGIWGVFIGVCIAGCA